MQIGTVTTDTDSMRLIITIGVVTLAVDLDPDDEDIVIQRIQEGFAEARAARNGHVHS